MLDPILGSSAEPGNFRERVAATGFGRPGWNVSREARGQTALKIAPFHADGIYWNGKAGGVEKERS
jgi:hypothetical protein